MACGQGNSPTDTALTNGHGSVLLKSGASGRRNFFFHLYISSKLTIRGDSFVDVTNGPREGIIEGSFGSGSNSLFTVTIYDATFEYYTPLLVKACNSVVRLVSNPPTIGFPIESVAVEGVAQFTNVIITDPKSVNIQILLDGSYLTNKDIKVGDAVKLLVSLNTSAIAPGQNFYGNITIQDLYDNFLNMSNGKSFLNITYNGNQFLKLDSKVVNGICTVSSISIPKIYSSPIIIQAGFYSQLNQLFLSESIELPVFNLTKTEPKTSIQPQKSIADPQQSTQPITPTRSFNNPTNPPTIKSNQRLNEATSTFSSIGKVIFSFLLIFNILQ